MTAVQAAAAWQQEWAEMTAHAELPVIVFPWHDYGITGFDDPDYNVQMFTSLIETAYQAGSEFVTLADLAQRINAFEKSGLTFNMVDADTISATVGSTGFLGTFALDLDGGQKIKSVAGWYAYDEDSVFLPSAGGSFTIDLGATPDDVTHITALPSRAELLSATSPGGGGLDFSVKGEGKLVIDLANPNGRPVSVTGATVTSLVGDRLELSLTGLGQHDVSVRIQQPSQGPGPGDELLIGTDGADWIDALAGNDTVNAGAGDDTLIGGAGDDWLDGGAGYDIAAMGTIGFRGVGVGLSGGSAVMTSSAGTDRLANTEIVTFADGRLVMDENDPAARVTRL
jgi:Ca2+-binding RTX toxin-like protein